MREETRAGLGSREAGGAVAERGAGVGHREVPPGAGRWCGDAGVGRVGGWVGLCMG